MKTFLQRKFLIFFTAKNYFYSLDTILRTFLLYSGCCKNLYFSADTADSFLITFCTTVFIEYLPHQANCKSRRNFSLSLLFRSIIMIWTLSWALQGKEHNHLLSTCIHPNSIKMSGSLSYTAPQRWPHSTKEKV